MLLKMSQNAIEDVSDYFYWRLGAAKAIFYLGDEALEGGGEKTEQEDIAAANQAIQKAKAAGVTVYTYFVPLKVSIGRALKKNTLDLPPRQEDKPLQIKMLLMALQ